jgi:asparagine synthase (glutamine-hydrolysing)
MAASLHSNLAIFHADVVGRHSERAAAAGLAKHLKLELHVVEVRDGDFIDALPDVIAHYERPVTIRSESMPFLRVCQLVQQHGVKGVLSGEAADECFLGYQSMMPGLDVLWKWLPRPTLYGLRNLYKRMVQGRHAELARLEQHPDLARPLLTRFEVELDRADNGSLRTRSGEPIGADDLKTLNALGYHLRTLLHRNDTLGMAASIESRFPFLDSSVVRFAVNLPYEYKIRRTRDLADVRHPFHRDKWILREVARRRVPGRWSRRPKRAFPTNAIRRMRIAPEFFRDSYVAGLFELGSRELAFLCSNARQDFQQRLLQLEVWAQTCLLGACVTGVRDRLRRHVHIEPDRQ